MKIKANINNLNIPETEIQALRGQVSSALDSLWGSKDLEDAWVQIPMKYTGEDIEYLLNAADYVKGWAKLMVVIGNPASCAGPKAAIEALDKYEYGIDVLFAGSDFDPDKIMELTEKVKANETVLCLLSDYQETPEAAVAFAILKEALQEKLDNQQAVARRIIVVTDKGTRMREEAEREGYLTVTSPTGLNGCFNMLAIEGLLPMSVAGLDVRTMLEGAKEAALSPAWDADGADYAIARHLMACKGCVMEWIVPTDSKLEAAAQWLKRLYAECSASGNDGQAQPKGMLYGLRSWPADTYVMNSGAEGVMNSGAESVRKPAAAAASFDTILRTEERDSKITVPSGTLEGKSLTQLQEDALEAFVREKAESKEPVVQIFAKKLDAAAFGQFIYFFEMSGVLTKILRESC